MKKYTMSLMILLFAAIPVKAQLQVMSYNIKYANENDGENSWSNRKDDLAAQLRFYEPHIFGVQEALQGQLEFLENELDNQYQFFGKGRDDGAQKGEFSAIFFKADDLELLKEGTFWLSSTPETPGKGWDAAYPRVCTYGKFRVKDSGKEFWVFNTHFDHVGKEARRQSVRLIHNKISELNKKKLPVVLMGDLNLEPDTEEVNYLASHFKDSKKVADHTFGPEGTFNAYKFHEPVTTRIDYIFTDGEVQVKKYAVLSDSKDLRYFSDHLPVMVELKLK
ncbi:endonuclease/exonuclease/phosphatase family protein [Salinimicrobium sp. MT39]|uniref:Endonuclease/exonuclease/phosphatase family protein n=1 Tax=Salinimicrobium profundisediminis TaxID=2994553 RepID=A0A9X3I162_9FLAO|nr:endonuclease/exonuclease/phosphatase family protein [Salinimicrobium profundisediminis]MCX2838611.1 endonuclease/exonuclease/phosphatase family protein [Salinimicrobium profundisediminis]